MVINTHTTTVVSALFDNNTNHYGVLCHLVTYYELVRTKFGTGAKYPAFANDLDELEINEIELLEGGVKFYGAYLNKDATITVSFEDGDVLVEISVEDVEVSLLDIFDKAVVGTFLEYIKENPFKPEMVTNLIG